MNFVFLSSGDDAILNTVGLTNAKPFEIERDLSKLSEGLKDDINYDGVFTLVKKAVKAFLGKERTGLGLALSRLPAELGAFWQVGGNYVIVNKSLIDALRAAGRSQLEINSFVFVILMHEYVHSIGVLDEVGARELTKRICQNLFPVDHPAYIISSKDPWQVYPFLKMVRGGRGESIEFVRHFDTDSASYIM
ncbi:MAG: hypothetical protein QXN66_03955 [Thermoplasmatales archaeon]